MTTRKVTKFTGIQVFNIPLDDRVSTLIYSANTGSVTLEVQLDADADQWIVHDTYTGEGIQKVDANGCTVRINATGGAEAAFVRL